MQLRGRTAAQGHPSACMALIPLLPAARCPGSSSGAVDLEPSPLRGRAGRAPAILAAAARPVPFVPAPIAALPRQPGCFYLRVRAAAAVAGGLRGWGPPASVQTSSGCEHNSQGPAFEKQGDAARPPWGTSKVWLCTAEKVRVFDGYPGTGPGTRGHGLSEGKWKGERRQRGENTGTGTQPCGSLPWKRGPLMNSLGSGSC